MSAVFDHPILRGLFGDPAISALLSSTSELAQMRRIEASYARALGAVGRVPADLAEQTAKAIEGADFREDGLRLGTGRDGVVVPNLVKQLARAMPEELHSALHQGLTSQDVIDTSLVLTLRGVNQILSARLIKTGTLLDDLTHEHGTVFLMGRTRMQAARGITVADRVQTWRLPLKTHLDRLAEMRGRLENVQLGGAVGTFGADQKDREIIAYVAKDLNLGVPERSWHAMRDTLADYANWLSLITGTLGKMGQDVALMAAQTPAEITLKGGGSSSAMPHKQNPVHAEVLISCARFNAVLLGGMHQALVHEQERSGAAWMLEGMILPQMIHATAAALNSAIKVAEAVVHIGETDKK